MSRITWERLDDEMVWITDHEGNAFVMAYMGLCWVFAENLLGSRGYLFAALTREEIEDYAEGFFLDSEETFAGRHPYPCSWEGSAECDFTFDLPSLHFEVTRDEVGDWVFESYSPTYAGFRKVELFRSEDLAAVMDEANRHVGDQVDLAEYLAGEEEYNLEVQEVVAWQKEGF